MTVGKETLTFPLFKHHYSVPKEYVGRRMTILYDADTVEIYCGMNLATPTAVTFPYTYSWKRSTTCLVIMVPMTRTWRNSFNVPRK